MYDNMCVQGESIPTMADVCRPRNQARRNSLGWEVEGPRHRPVNGKTNTIVPQLPQLKKMTKTSESKEPIFVTFFFMPVFYVCVLFRGREGGRACEM